VCLVLPNKRVTVSGVVWVWAEGGFTRFCWFGVVWVCEGHSLRAGLALSVLGTPVPLTGSMEWHIHTRYVHAGMLDGALHAAAAGRQADTVLAVIVGALVVASPGTCTSCVVLVGSCTCTWRMPKLGHTGRVHVWAAAAAAAADRPNHDDEANGS
jgi:hypothetical protein